MRYLDHFELVVLDMNGTFMFGQDRFDETQDFAATYRRLGGEVLADDEVNTYVRQCCGLLDQHYNDSAYIDDFPSVSWALQQTASATTLPPATRGALESVIAHHECGYIPDELVACLLRLAGQHRLALLSNLWSKPALWLQQFAVLGLTAAFDFMLFSSETRSIKPSPRLFAKLLDQAGVPASKAVYIGDDVSRDVAGAHGAGMATVWLSHGHVLDPDAKTTPDRTIADLTILEGLV